MYVHMSTLNALHILYIYIYINQYFEVVFFKSDTFISLIICFLPQIFSFVLGIVHYSVLEIILNS